ncbi:pyrrolo-quinoline quinone [Dinoroseobacter shibae DFL 12 = DSM 16493]|uniref:Pyrrolo-quinoline quinone n=2 Tax=Dinoroseobacter shibae TaxID=215813 RepID=A8LHW0_DINSH|nr:PQQ-binding-like beta-propeller repeat protein [Dinoroseobacter shibae]ABV92907.1 pyrrolo-quinoline quinone [Dinoroseobacter shibae DFL 12 = DSM 16493]URF47843.1 PQQ-like beta-propeller repeat protein [Dinoroseobacter shibae]URF52152.1 PQQ-like beta-propeller repeat protein [Dinoroseobacter shibae]
MTQAELPRMRPALAGLALLGLAACAPEEVILPGERLDIRTPTLVAEGETAAPVALVETTPRTVPLSLPAPVANSDWTHRNGSVRHTIPHPALGTQLQLAWRAEIGEGSTRRNRITAAPVVSDGRVFTLDSLATVSAFGTNGALLWQQDLTPPTDAPDEGTGGGLAVSGDTLYVSSGFGSLTALNVVDGTERWTQRMDAPISGSATVEGNVAYAVSRDSVAWALDTRNGRVLWTLPGVPSTTSILGGGAPALTDRLVILPFPSSEISGALRQSGVRIWGSAVSGARLGRGYTAFSDINSDPVVVGRRIFAGNAAGRVAALDAVSGERLWTAREGAFGPVWPAGGELFFVSDQNGLVRMDADTGAVTWIVQLPYYTDDRERRRKAIFAHYGPVLAGGRLIIASGDGRLRLFDPVSGLPQGEIALPDGAAAPPVVANRTLYVVTTGGELLAFR